ncbi:helix-turn-helix transcriptional regulator [Carbonactinospora thermoautotrophica]|uniref:HTH cro/C1-type domain-containing protein n=3 Tax=Carbonactinospora thermoautotrophica TaxID=1469144 RepID=A0A132MUZ9_9ACTN|nr:helix-turn-helix transcriptional regulator [Carbonactinospora thermoautotrophica]KWX01624.1 hypothetical protein LI90_2656 [Carbonactinospora thermoautotrophica]
MAGHAGRGTAPVANRTLRSLRERRNLTQQEFAEAIRKKAADMGLNLGCDEKRVSRWERGEVTWPSAAYRRVLMALLEMPVEEMGFIPPWRETTAQSRLNGASEAAVEAAGDDDPVKRRELLRVSALLTASDSTWPDGSAAAESSGLRVRMSDVERVRATTRTFDELDHKYGGGEVRASVVQYLNGTVVPMLHGSYPEDVERELFNAAAVLTELVGWMSYDTGDHRAARHYFERALDLCDAVQDRAYAGFVLASMSHQALYLGHGREAVELARSAQHRAAGAAPALVAAECHVMEARGHALIGDYRSCVDALRKATQAFESADPACRPQWMGTFDETVFATQVGTCFRDLRRPREALRFMEQAVAKHHPAQTRRRVYGNVVLATIAVQQGELDTACALGVEATQLASRIASRRSVEHVRDLVYQLSPYQHTRYVREFIEQARGLVGVA